MQSWGTGQGSAAHSVAHGPDVLVNQGITTDEFTHLFHGAVVRHQFFGRGHVDAVHIGKTDRGCGTRHVDLAGTSVTRHLHDLSAGGAAHDGVVHQQHVAAFEFADDDVEFLTHGFFAHRLARHDEGATHVAVFHKAFAVGFAQQMRQLGGAGTAGLGDGNHHINVGRWHGGHHALGQGFTQIQSRLVHRNAVHRRVRPRQIHVFKNTRHELRVLGTLLGMQLALHVDEHGFTGRDVTHKPVARAFQGHRLAADHPGAIRPFAQTQWPNAIGVAKRHHAVARNHGHHRI